MWPGRVNWIQMRTRVEKLLERAQIRSLTPQTSSIRQWNPRTRHLRSDLPTEPAIASITMTSAYSLESTMRKLIVHRGSTLRQSTAMNSSARICKPTNRCRRELNRRLHTTKDCWRFRNWHRCLHRARRLLAKLQTKYWRIQQITRQIMTSHNKMAVVSRRPKEATERRSPPRPNDLSKERTPTICDPVGQMPVRRRFRMECTCLMIDLRVEASLLVGVIPLTAQKFKESWKN